MADIKTFHLPDLGEGLPDATIVEWLVKQGGVIKLDEPLVSMETAKAVVEVPSPFSGKLVKQHGGAGDVINTGAALAEFELDPNAPQRAEAEATGHHHGPPAAKKTAEQSGKGAGNQAPDGRGVIASDEGGELDEPQAAPKSKAAPTGKTVELREDSGTVVGAMEASDHVAGDRVSSVGGVKAMPAVRALAKKMGVDLARVKASGKDGVITLKDIKDAAASGGARVGTAPQAASRAATPTLVAASRAPETRTALASNGKPVRTRPPQEGALGQPEQLKGVRRNMARVMAQSHAEVAATTIVDDADLHAWQPGNDVTARIVRAIVAGAREVPALNAWFDGENLTRTLHPHVDIGLAVDTDDGLFVPALRNADVLDANGLRAAVNRLRTQVMDRSIPAEELRGYTIMLSNFGMFAGRYATPVVVPPCVAIVGAGRLHHAMVPVVGGFDAHRLLPLSITFDHRACTGGEAARFLKAMIDDLASPV